MKVAVQCESPLLQRSLELFLKGHLSSLKQCDVVISDRRMPDVGRRSLLVSSNSDADIVKPFSRSQLMIVLEQALKKEEEMGEIAAITEAMEEVAADEEPLDFKILEKRIELLTKEYQQNILKAVRAFYER